MIHSGSRHLGLEVCNFYQKRAYEALNGATEEEKRGLIAELKSQGREREIQKELKRLADAKRTDIPKQLAYVEDVLFAQYIHDMEIMQGFAARNREAMMDVILKGMGLHAVDSFATIHNYIDTETMILRKGAVSARERAPDHPDEYEGWEPALRREGERGLEFFCAAGK